MWHNQAKRSYWQWCNCCMNHLIHFVSLRGFSLKETPILSIWLTRKIRASSDLWKHNLHTSYSIYFRTSVHEDDSLWVLVRIVTVITSNTTESSVIRFITFQHHSAWFYIKQILCFTLDKNNNRPILRRLRITMAYASGGKWSAPEEQTLDLVSRHI